MQLWPAEMRTSGPRSPEVEPVAGGALADKTFLIRFKWATYVSPRLVLAARPEVRGEHLILLNSQGQAVKSGINAWIYRANIRSARC
jgi:hypothetical protein